MGLFCLVDGIVLVIMIAMTEAGKSDGEAEDD
jgi:hypothetical protein